MEQTRASSELPLEELASNDKHSCFAIGNIVLTRSLWAPDAVYLREWVNALERYAQTQPRALGVVILIDERAHPPNEAERNEIRQAYTSVKHIVRGAVQVVEGHGFMAAAKRSALMIINLTAGIGVPIKVVGALPEALPTLAKMLGDAMDPRIDAAALTRAAALCTRACD
jgi:hypothetical protein